MPKPTSLSKFTCPRPLGVLARERLFATLDRRRQSSVIWVTGPAGSGKTTLVASYVQARRPDCCWYQLEHGDSEVASFFYYMSLAVNGGESGGSLPFYTAEYHSDLSAFARGFFRSFYTQLKPPFVLVFDNYQDVAAQSVFHDLMLDAVAELPPEGCIMVASRTDPPPSMVRLRANRILDLVGGQELSLTREESDALVALWGTALCDQALAQLYEKTQGWAAGLVLMLDQARTTGDLGELPDESGPQLVFDYLAGEVFQELDESTRALLLNTAFLPEMTADMACELTGQEAAGETLARLHRSYHFVTLKPRAAEHVFQYHPLFREFLQLRAHQALPPEECARLQRASASILVRVGNFDAAVDLLRGLEDWGSLRELIRVQARNMLEQGRVETLERWLEELPLAELEPDAPLICWRAACRMHSAPRESRLLYEQAYAVFERARAGQREGMLLACSGAMDAIMQELDDLSLLDRWIERVETMLEHDDGIPWPEVRVRLTVSMMMALVLRQPQHPDITRWAKRVYDEVRIISDTNSRSLGQLMLALNLNYTGQFARARELLQTMRSDGQSPDATPHALTVLKDAESLYAMFTADFARCLEAVYDGIEIGRSTGAHVWSYHLLSNGVAGALGAGDLDTARELLAQLERYAKSARRLDLCVYHYSYAWYAMLRGDVLAAFQEQKTALRLAVETGCPFYEVLCRIGLVQVLVECGEPGRAIPHLRAVRSASRKINNRLLEFMTELSYAAFALEHGHERSGLSALGTAMAVGREHGFSHALWWQPRVMARLCQRALQAGIEVDYVRELVRKRDLVPDPLPLRVECWPWRFRIRSLGEFTVSKDDERIGRLGKPQQKPAALLRALVGLGAKDVKELSLASVLWPRIDGDYALRSLTTTLHRLRKLLGEDKALVLSHGRLSLNERYCWLDIWAFEQYTSEIDAMARLSDPREMRDDVARLVAKLLDLYRGPFLVSEAEAQWCRPLRERLRNQFLRYMGELIRFFEELGEWEHAVDCYWRGLEVDRFAEGFYRRLMLCYRELGRSAEAMDVYDSCRQTLAAELAAEPSPETTAIYRNLVQDV